MKKTTTNIKHLGMVGLCCLALAGCATTPAEDVYSREGKHQVESIQVGTVESIRPVTIAGEVSPIGGRTASILGQVAGAVAGGGGIAGQLLGSLGGLFGGIAGSAAEEAMMRKEGLQITVALSSGESLAIVQASSDLTEFEVGDSVKVIERNGVQRIVKQQTLANTL
jgi:outer membrane lipoprotein SlyB